MKRKNTLAFILSACVLAGALGGCGDKPAESSSLPSSTPSSSQTVESSEPESNVPDYMKRSPARRTGTICFFSKKPRN